MKGFLLAVTSTFLLILRAASAQEIPSQEQRLELLLFPMIVLGSLAISLAISAALYRSSRARPEAGKRKK
jgi:hypothetical protein